VMLDITPPVIYSMTRGLDNFSSDEDNDCDSDREDPSNQPTLWVPEGEVYHDNALVCSMSGFPLANDLFL
jgi:hypothetical protein